MTIIVSGQLHVDAAERAAFLAARVPIIAHARHAPGCLDFSLSADPAAAEVELHHISASEAP